MNTTDYIVVEHLVKRFQDKVVVDNLSLDIKPGELFVLVGPSGCGKTTTLRLLAGLEAVSDGRIQFGDRLVNEIRPKERNVAMVFQDYAIFPHMSVFENIAYGLRSRNASRALIRERVPEAARTFRIDHLLKRKPRQLSGGERQRVALARSMVREPVSISSTSRSPIWTPNSVIKREKTSYHCIAKKDSQASMSHMINPKQWRWAIVSA